MKKPQRRDETTPSESAEWIETTARLQRSMIAEPLQSGHVMERQRSRRLRLILDLTSTLIRNDQSMSHREARCLVRCAEKAILEIEPTLRESWDDWIGEHFDRLLRDRWPVEESFIQLAREMVN